MNILIIGSKGFIGSHCVDYYRAKGFLVAGADVVVDYTDPNYFLIDATNSDFRELFENQPFDICINCSGAASVPDSLIHPRRDFELNTLNVYRMLDAIRLYQPACRFIQISSAAIYGNPVQLPIMESAVASPISPYGWHKFYTEQICHQFAGVYNLKIAILRPFSVFGAGLKKQLFWDVYHKIRTGPFELFGTGEETRDFIHISDLIQMTELLINKGSFSGEVYNAANGAAVKIKEIIKDFVDLSGFKILYSFSNKTKPGDPIYWQADISKILSLGYKQSKSHKEGLKEYIEWAALQG